MGFFDKAKDAIKEVLAPPAPAQPAPALPAPAPLHELARTPASATSATPEEPTPTDDADTPVTPQSASLEPAPEPAPEPEAEAETPPVDAGSSAGRLKVYTVKAGDTLAEIAQRYGVDPMDIARLNHLETPDRILPGMVFTIPATD